MHKYVYIHIHIYIYIFFIERERETNASMRVALSDVRNRCGDECVCLIMQDDELSPCHDEAEAAYRRAVA